MERPLDPAGFDLIPGTWAMHCSEGPVPRAAFEAGRRMLERELHPWDMDFRRDLLGVPVAVRQGAAAVLGVDDPADVSLTQSTSTGLVLLAQTFPWRPGDEVLVPLGEFPANAWPWKALAARGVTFREVPLWDGQRAGRDAWLTVPPTAGARPEERLADAIAPATRLVAASWVRFQDGLRLDLATLGSDCAARGVPLIVDGVQGAGTALPSLRGVAAFVTGGHKGLLGPAGQGFVWTQPMFRAEIGPAGSWLSVVDGTNWARPGTDLDRGWLADGRRLEAGNYNLLGAAVLAESLALLAKAGVDRIAAHVDALQGMLLQRLSGTAWGEDAARLEGLRAAGRLGSILSFDVTPRGPAGAMELVDDGARHGVHASVREGFLRIALHGWHGAVDVDRVAAWLAAA